MTSANKPISASAKTPPLPQQNTFTNGKSYAKIVLAIGNCRENISEKQIPGNTQEPPQTSSRNHSKGAIPEKKVPFQSQNQNVINNRAVQEESLADDFEVVVRKSRVGNNKVLKSRKNSHYNGKNKDETRGGHRNNGQNKKPHLGRSLDLPNEHPKKNLENEASSSSTISNISSSDKDVECVDSTAALPQYVVAPPPKVNPWLKVKSIETTVVAMNEVDKKKGCTSQTNSVVHGASSFDSATSHQSSSVSSYAKLVASSSSGKLPIQPRSSVATPPPPNKTPSKEPSQESKDWPTLEQAYIAPPPPTKKKPEKTFRKSESTDSGNEDPFQTTSTEDKHCTKSGSGGGQPVLLGEQQTGVVPPDPIHHKSLSSDEVDETQSRRGKKQKWVPLNIPENSRHSKRKPIQKKVHGEKESSSREMIKSNNFRRKRGGGNNSARGGGGNGRTTTTEPNGNANEYHQDYHMDYTTLPPLYPMTEFVMPYSSEGYYNPLSPDAVLTGAQLLAGYVPVEPSILLEMVKKQIEYYFSQENLEKDFFLRRKMNADGFLPVHLIAKFNRVKIMVQDPTIVIQGIQASEELELSEDFYYVRTRNEPQKWPIKDDQFTPNYCAQVVASNYSSSLSTTDLNPNVAEFIPRS